MYNSQFFIPSLLLLKMQYSPEGWKYGAQDMHPKSVSRRRSLPSSFMVYTSAFIEPGSKCRHTIRSPSGVKNGPAVVSRPIRQPPLVAPVRVHQVNLAEMGRVGFGVLAFGCGHLLGWRGVAQRAEHDLLTVGRIGAFRRHNRGRR
jgi:hypothetical protein